MTTTPAATTTAWGVTAIAHPALRGVNAACPDCLALADSAVAHARVTGSTGATMTSKSADEVHSVTVARLVSIVEVAR